MKEDLLTKKVRGAVDWLVRLSGATWYYITATAKKALEDDILFLTSGLAFNSVLTLVPILLLSASALGIILNSSTETVKHLNEILNAMVPAQPYSASIRESLLRIVSDIVAYRKSLGLFGVGVLVFTATSLFDAVRSVLQKVYRLQRTRGLFLSFIHDIGFVLLVFFLFVSVNLVTWGFSLLEGLAAESPFVALLGLQRITRYLPTGVVLVVAAMMFYIVFRFIPDTRPPKTAGVISTLCTTLLWVVSGKVFAFYLGHFSAIGRIYGPYAFLLVLLLWIYYSSLVFVIGAMVGQVYWERLAQGAGAKT